MTTVKVVTSRIYCHTTSHLGRTPLLFGLVLNGLEILKLISGSFPRQRLESWMNKFQNGVPILQRVHSEPLGDEKKILELLLTAFLTYN